MGVASVSDLSDAALLERFTRMSRVDTASQEWLPQDTAAVVLHWDQPKPIGRDPAVQFDYPLVYVRVPRDPSGKYLNKDTKAGVWSAKSPRSSRTRRRPSPITRRGI